MFKNQNSKSGFTIIEVVLVLAIAGLIFLMVFVALPTLQRNQRDAQRKRQAETFRDSLVRMKTNGARTNIYGFYPNTSVEAMVERGYLKEDEMQDPLTGVVFGAFNPSANNEDLPTDDRIAPGMYITAMDSDCTQIDENTPAHVGQGKTAFWFGMESGGDYCVDIDGRYQGNRSISV